MENIKNIIFDYGNVIFSIDFLRVQQSWNQLGISNPEAFFGHKTQDEIFDKFDRGEVTAAQFRDYVREKTNNLSLTDDQIDAAWNSILVGIAEGNHELLLKLKDKYRTFLLSNINAIHYDYIMNYLKTDFGFDGNDHLFEKTYYSHLTGKRKPEPAIFEQVLKENNLISEETLFIDDSPQHLEVAKKLGIQTFLMTAPDTIQSFAKREQLI
ncbi:MULTISPECIES: HAD family hydrolase [Mucilaginibacter]|nr:MULTISPECIES: HAD family phosphatase [Mucilaginibacter]QTE40978.1 HAD family phosphatase [Mucilaginibacter rubeus]QTE47581.1 HAD family phosphatase [Mucilaginibacter rubeus]QTE58972.1 HAD family phosphatase [Mucilaginibacter rubeus]QTE61567.1 HAD family phosphatase [Mucilaginibacter rubeus]QTF60325.1 HAD family phosphatase [Mucilaginibacter rubeus]